MNDLTILLLHQAFASSVAITLDVLSSTNLIAKQLGLAPLHWRLVSIGGGEITLSNSMKIATSKLGKRTSQDMSLWVIPGLGTSAPESVRARMQDTDAQAVAQAIASQVKQGGKVAASCSAVFLLELAGVLKQKTVTTTWWLAPLLSRSESNPRVDAKRLVIADGNIITAGAALAHTDLMLHLIRTLRGAALADAVSKVLLIDTRTTQAQYVIPAVLASGDELVSQLSAKVEAALPNVPTIAQLATAMCMSERTLARHVVSATGLPPLALIQQVRLARAKALLEKSRMPVETVAHQVGYSDATALRRMMMKAIGATPQQLRGR
jgi:transcriptional regulator GlxA family with amidase domain